MIRKMNLEQKREYFLKRMIEQLKEISRYEQNDNFMEKLFKKTEKRYNKAQRNYYKMKHKKERK